MDDGASLLAAILDDPADTLARLVYADYLDDHNERGPVRVRAQRVYAPAPDQYYPLPYCTR